MKAADFSFAKHASSFEQHISSSIPGFHDLRRTLANIAPSLIQPKTNVVEIGTSCGTFLRMVRDETSKQRGIGVQFLGLDSESAFGEGWSELVEPDLKFEVADACAFRYKNVSLAISIFTLQFIPRSQKLQLLRALHDGLVPGGCLMIAEKLLANTPRMQDALTFQYYDFKQENGFTAEDILNKERQLRGYMTSNTEAELKALLAEAGFGATQEVWRRFPFMAMIAEK